MSKSGDQHFGECVGGPLNGHRLAHESKRYEMFKYKDGFDSACFKIGEYRLNNYHQWHWWETPEGAALRTLEGL